MSISSVSTAIYAAKPRRHFSLAMMKAVTLSCTNNLPLKTKCPCVWKLWKVARLKQSATTATNNCTLGFPKTSSSPLADEVFLCGY